MKKVLILGADGMLGHRVFREFRAANDFEVFGTIRKDFVELPTYHSLFENPDLIIDNLDASDLMAATHVVNQIKPDFIINCIGIIKQRADSASNASLMMQVNGILPHVLHGETVRYGGKLITISSDCVFLGNRAGPYYEEEEGDAHSLYGRTKYVGEVSHGNALTLRTSFIGFEVKGFISLLEWFFSAVAEQRERATKIRGFTQAVWSGVTTRYIAELLLDIARDHQDLNGLYHIATNPVTKFELLNMLSLEFGLGAVVARDDLYIEDKVCNRWMACLKFPSATGIEIPAIDQLLPDLVDDYKFYKAHRE